ncbi:MAG: hypothetical protein IJJ26_09360, partial [Victivallales bacterium]|nr:hypothetical protein [Victivallales bacterium]
CGNAVRGQEAQRTTVIVQQEAVRPQVRVQQEKRLSVTRAERFTPFALGIVGPLNLPPSDYDVTVLRFNLLSGIHNNLSVIDIAGLANIVRGNMSGLSLGTIWNEVDGDMLGMQFSVLANYVGGNASGLQCSLVNYNDNLALTTGLQIGVLMNNAGHLVGAQLGVINMAESLEGFQLGVLNVTSELRGIQLGLFNIATDAPLPAMILLNMAF